MKGISGIIVLIVLAAGIAALFSSAYTVAMTEQVIVTQFGKPVGAPVVEAGLHFKVPFIQDINVIEKRILSWDGRPNEMPTKDKTYIVVDTFGRWRISDPMQYFLRLSDERSALSRLDDILGSETRNAVANNELVEVVRSTKDRKPEADPALIAADVIVLKPIEIGRTAIERNIFERASPKLREFGIELLDVRFKRINYHESVRRGIYARMISERRQIAERFRSEGAGEAAKITGGRERELQEIESAAYRTVQEIRGQADARASEIYAAAYNQGEAAVEFYELLKSLEAYPSILNQDTTLVLTTNSDLFRFIKSIDP